MLYVSTFPPTTPRGRERASGHTLPNYDQSLCLGETNSGHKVCLGRGLLVKEHTGTKHICGKLLCVASL